MRAMVLILVLFTTVVPALAQPKHAIKSEYHAGINTSRDFSSTGSEKSVIQFYDAAGKLLSESKPEGMELRSTVRIINADRSNRPTKFVVEYTKSAETIGGKRLPHSYEGKMLLLEKQPTGKFRIGAKEGDTIDPKDIEDLYFRYDKVNLELEAFLKALNTEQPVAMNQAWNVSADTLADVLSIKLDPSTKSVITAKLTDVKNQNKQKIGTIEFEATIYIKSLDRWSITFEKPAVNTMKGSITFPIDGSIGELTRKMHSTIEGGGTLPAGGSVAKMVFKVDSQTTDSISAPKPTDTAFKTPDPISWLPRPGDWVSFSPKSERFRVELPGSPRYENPKGKELTEMWLVGLNDESLVYSVSVTEYKADPKKIDVKAVYKALLASFKNVKVSQEIIQNGYPALEVIYEKDKVIHYHRAVLVNSVLFQLIIADARSQSKTEDRNRFYQSFELPKKK